MSSYMTPKIPTKVCATCKRELELGLFAMAKCNKDGHNHHCRTCNSENMKKTPSYKKYSRGGKQGGKKWQRMNFNNETN